MPTKASRAAATLADRLGNVGVDASPTQVQGWIDRGWLGTREQTYPGGGGSATVLGPAAFDVAAAISCLPVKERSETNVALARYLRGLPVSEAEIRAAFRSVVGELYGEAGMDGVAGADEDTVAAAALDRAARIVARRRRPPVLRMWGQGLRSWADTSGDAELADTPTDELTSTLLASLLAAFSGDVSHLQGSVESLAAAGGFLPALDDLAEPEWRPRDILDEGEKKLMAVVEDWWEVAADVTADEAADARHVQVAMMRLLAAADQVDLVEGRLNRPWGVLHHQFAAMCLTFVILARRGFYDLADLRLHLAAATP